MFRRTTEITEDHITYNSQIFRHIYLGDPSQNIPKNLDIPPIISGIGK